MIAMIWPCGLLKSLAPTPRQQTWQTSQLKPRPNRRLPKPLPSLRTLGMTLFDGHFSVRCWSNPLRRSSFHGQTRRLLTLLSTLQPIGRYLMPKL